VGGESSTERPPPGTFNGAAGGGISVAGDVVAGGNCSPGSADVTDKSSVADGASGMLTPATEGVFTDRLMAEWGTKARGAALTYEVEYMVRLGITQIVCKLDLDSGDKSAKSID